MIEELNSALQPLLPLKIGWVEYTDPVLTLGGDGWSLSLACPWRLVSGTSVVSAWDDVDVEDSSWDLVGHQITNAGSRIEENREDPAFSLTGELRLEVLADSDLDPWVLRLPSQTLVGRSQQGGPGT